MDTCDLIEFGKVWAKLGWSIQEQVADVMASPNADVNPNAIKLARDDIGALITGDPDDPRDELHDALNDWLEENE
jgi:hypothetical protein